MAKPYNISKYAVLEAFHRVKDNKGAAGVDDESIKEFEENLKDNLYKIWNRMSSGSYFPPPVKAVEIPKTGGGIRKLGIPTVADRVAQMVVKIYIEPILEPIFHPDSYGYRPKKSAHDAIKIVKQRCWNYDWVIDIDIKGFFDTIDHELMMRAIEKHTQEPWILLCIERWLKAFIKETDGSLVERLDGTPQGGVISPILANLFLHYAFDEWMKRNYPQNPFARYADDMVVHCKTEKEALMLLEAIKGRFLACKLTLHPEKTKIVYCKDSNRKGNSEFEKFDFLGYTFRPRSSRNWKGVLFTNFSPAISDKAAQKIRDRAKEWLRKIRPNDDLNDLAALANPAVTGWVNYYGKHFESELWKLMNYFEVTLIKWAWKKYEKLSKSWRKGRKWLEINKKRRPNLFKHWRWMYERGIG